MGSNPAECAIPEALGDLPGLFIGLEFRRVCFPFQLHTSATVPPYNLSIGVSVGLSRSYRAGTSINDPRRTALTHDSEKLTTATLLLASLGLFANQAQANLTPQQSAAILKTYDGSDPTDFRHFLSKLAGSNLAKADTLNETLTTYLAGKPLNADQQNEINRLLGLYTRIKYGKAATETLRELVAIPTFQSRACHSTRTRSSSRSPKNQDPGRGLRSEIPQHRQPGL